MAFLYLDVFLFLLSAPYTLTNHNEINSDDTLPFIIFIIPVSWVGSNRFRGQRLLLSPCSHDVINKCYSASFGRLPPENAERFAESLNDIVFIDISDFTARFAFGVFVYGFVQKGDHIVLNCIHSNTTLTLTFF